MIEKGTVCLLLNNTVDWEGNGLFFFSANYSEENAYSSKNDWEENGLLMRQQRMGREWFCHYLTIDWEGNGQLFPHK
jgi:hypothetical protein